MLGHAGSSFQMISEQMTSCVVLISLSQFVWAHLWHFSLLVNVSNVSLSRIFSSHSQVVGILSNLSRRAGKRWEYPVWVSLESQSWNKWNTGDGFHYKYYLKIECTSRHCWFSLMLDGEGSYVVLASRGVQQGCLFRVPTGLDRIRILIVSYRS